MVSRATPATRLAFREPRGRLPPLLVAPRERVGFDQIGCLVDQLELTIELGATDAGLGPEVMVFVDANVAFGRALEFHTGRSRGDLVHVEAARLLDRQFPQPRAQISSLGDVTDRGLLAPHLLEGGNESLVVRIVE